MSAPCVTNAATSAALKSVKLWKKFVATSDFSAKFSAEKIFLISSAESIKSCRAFANRTLFDSNSDLMLMSLPVISVSPSKITEETLVLLIKLTAGLIATVSCCPTKSLLETFSAPTSGSPKLTFDVTETLPSALISEFLPTLTLAFEVSIAIFALVVMYEPVLSLAAELSLEFFSLARLVAPSTIFLTILPVYS